MNREVHIEVSGAVLVWARESLTLSLQQVIERTKISYSRLNQLESGASGATLNELKSLAKAYRRTLATLLLDRPPRELPLPADRRTADSQMGHNFDEKTILAVRKARALAQSYIELRKELGLSFPAFTWSASLGAPPQSIARQVYQRLQLDEIRAIQDTDLALDAYLEKVESLGVAVFQLPLTQDQLRGFSIMDDVVPIIGIKRGGEQPSAKTFTLFHELGHLMLNEGGLCDSSSHPSVETEKWCNAFAAELLVPRAELLRMSLVIDYQSRSEKEWKKKDLEELATHFHVSLLAILRSLLDAGRTTQAFYQQKHDQWNKPVFGRAKNPEGRNLAKEAIKEKGRTYVGLAFQAFDQNRLDLKDLCDFLGLKKLSDIPKTRTLMET